MRKGGGVGEEAGKGKCFLHKWWKRWRGGDVFVIDTSLLFLSSTSIFCYYLLLFFSCVYAKEKKGVTPFFLPFFPSFFPPTRLNDGLTRQSSNHQEMHPNVERNHPVGKSRRAHSHTHTHTHTHTHSLRHVCDEIVLDLKKGLFFRVLVIHIKKKYSKQRKKERKEGNEEENKTKQNKTKQNKTNTRNAGECIPHGNIDNAYSRFQPCCVDSTTLRRNTSSLSSESEDCGDLFHTHPLPSPPHPTFPDSVRGNKKRGRRRRRRRRKKSSNRRMLNLIGPSHFSPPPPPSPPHCSSTKKIYDISQQQKERCTFFI